MKFIAYLEPHEESDGLRVLPLSDRRASFSDLCAYVAGFTAAGMRSTPDHLSGVRAVPGVQVGVQPGDIIALDLHNWHAFAGSKRRYAWMGEYVARPRDQEASDRVHAKFRAVVDASHVPDQDRWPIWRDWITSMVGKPNRGAAVTSLRQEGAFLNGADRL